MSRYTFIANNNLAGHSAGPLQLGQEDVDKLLSSLDHPGPTVIVSASSAPQMHQASHATFTGIPSLQI